MRRAAAFWLCAGVTTLNALVSVGFSLAALLSSTGDARVTAMYAFSRSAALVLLAAACAILRLRRGTLVMAALMVLVQAGDTVVGLAQGDLQKTVGPALLAVATAFAFVALRGQPGKPLAEGDV